MCGYKSREVRSGGRRAQELVNEDEGVSLLSERRSEGASLVPVRRFSSLDPDNKLLRSEEAGGREGFSQPAKLTSTSSTLCGMYVCTLLKRVGELHVWE